MLTIFFKRKGAKPILQPIIALIISFKVLDFLEE